MKVSKFIIDSPGRFTPFRRPFFTLKTIPRNEFRSMSKIEGRNLKKKKKFCEKCEATLSIRSMAWSKRNSTRNRRLFYLLPLIAWGTMVDRKERKKKRTERKETRRT